MDLKKHVLTKDIEEANKIIIWGNYCIAQMDYCFNKLNLLGVRYWNLEYQRSVNDLKYLQFKKMDKERVRIDAKL